MRDVDKILLIRESLNLEKILSEIKLFEIFNERKYLVDTLFNLRKVQSVLNIIVLFFFFLTINDDTFIENFLEFIWMHLCKEFLSLIFSK